MKTLFVDFFDLFYILFNGILLLQSNEESEK